MLCERVRLEGLLLLFFFFFFFPFLSCTKMYKLKDLDGYRLSCGGTGFGSGWPECRHVGSKKRFRHYPQVSYTWSPSACKWNPKGTHIVMSCRRHMREISNVGLTTYTDLMIERRGQARLGLLSFSFSVRRLKPGQEAWGGNNGCNALATMPATAGTINVPVP